MRPILEVLHEKERQVELLRGEIEALQAAARILDEAGELKPIPPMPPPAAMPAKNWP